MRSSSNNFRGHAVQVGSCVQWVFSYF